MFQTEYSNFQKLTTDLHAHILQANVNSPLQSTIDDFSTKILSSYSLKQLKIIKNEASQAKLNFLDFKKNFSNDILDIAYGLSQNLVPFKSAHQIETKMDYFLKNKAFNQAIEIVKHVDERLLLNIKVSYLFKIIHACAEDENPFFLQKALEAMPDCQEKKEFEAMFSESKSLSRFYYSLNDKGLALNYLDEKYRYDCQKIQTTKRSNLET